MQEAFYAARLRDRHGIEVVVPEPAAQHLVDGVIYEELCLANKEAVLSTGPIPEALIHLYKTRKSAP